MRCRPNYRLMKIHRNYTVEEVAQRLGTHKNTVRAWIKAGLPTCDGKRPTLILGRELATFLQARRASKKQPCQPGEIYCVRCRAPKTPAGDMVDYQPVTDNFGNLAAICPDCESIMNRRVSLTKLGLVQGKMSITFPKALRRISESNQPTVNSDLS
jgi:Helix-turn-helix domain